MSATYLDFWKESIEKFMANKAIGLVFGGAVTLATSLGVVRWVKKRFSPVKILVIGSGGVGKTTLASMLTGEKGSDKDHADYTETIGVESFSRSKGPKLEFVVLPGQSSRMESTSGPILEKLEHGGFGGVIFVASFGHHAIGDMSWRNHKLYNKTETEEQFLDQYLRYSREKENGLFNALCGSLSKCKKPIWLMIVVTKEDLWWSESDAVHNHYSSGVYRDLKKKCIGGRKDHEFLFERAFVSLLPRNLETGHGEVLKKTSPGYDQKHQKGSFAALVKKLHGVCSWGS